MANKLTRNENGSSPLVVVLGLVVVGMIGFTGYYVWHAQQTIPKPGDTQTAQQATAKKQQTPASSTTSTKPTLYCSDAGGYCFDYPADWQAKVSDTSDPNIKGLSISSASKSLEVRYSPFVSEIGGGCPPKTCYFTASSIDAVKGLDNIKIVKGIFENKDNGSVIPMWEVASTKSIAEYKIQQGVKTDVGYFYLTFNNSMKNSSNTQTLSVIPAAYNFETVDQINKWFASADAQKAGEVLASLRTK